jgi:hypothetical protein
MPEHENKQKATLPIIEEPLVSQKITTSNEKAISYLKKHPRILTAQELNEIITPQ